MAAAGSPASRPSAKPAATALAAAPGMTARPATLRPCPAAAATAAAASAARDQNSVTTSTAARLLATRRPEPARLHNRWVLGRPAGDPGGRQWRPRRRAPLPNSSASDRSWKSQARTARGASATDYSPAPATAVPGPAVRSESRLDSVRSNRHSVRGAISEKETARWITHEA